MHKSAVFLLPPDPFDPFFFLYNSAAAAAAAAAA